MTESPLPEAPTVALTDEERVEGHGGRDRRHAAGTEAMHTRASAGWTALVVAVVVLILLVIFIAENTQQSTVNFIGVHGHASTAVVILIAAIVGAAIVLIVGAARILQLRRAVRHPPDVPRPSERTTTPT